MSDIPSAERALLSYGDSLYRIALGMLRSGQDAEDAVSETMLRYLGNRRKFRDSEHEKAWLITVTLNICRDFLRRREKRSTIPLDELCEPIAEDSSSDILLLLAELPIESRQILLLHYIEGYSVRESARLLGIGESAAKMRLKVGRERLRGLWGEL